MKKANLAVFFLLLWNGCSLAQGYRPTGSVASESTYIFAPHPNLNPQDLFNAYTPLIRYLEKKMPGVRFTFEASKNYADYEEKIVGRSFHFGIPNPFQTVIGLNHGYRVIAKMKPDEDFRGVMVTRKDSNLRTPADLAGKPLCTISASAVAAAMLPLLYLHEHGVKVKDNKVKYVGSPFSAMTHVHSGEVPACSVAVRQWRAWERDNAGKAGELSIMFTTPPMPHNSVVARDDVPPAVARQVAAVLVGMEKDPELDQSQFKFDQNHYESASNDTYKSYVDFFRRFDKEIGLPPEMRHYAKP